jgi:putative transposase
MTTILKAYKYRIYPTKDQIELICKHIGSSRWVYNWALDSKIKAWKEQGVSLSRFDLQKQIPSLKQDEKTQWLSEVNAQSLQASLENLDKAYRRFFRINTGFPKFKSKHGSKQSFSIPQYVRMDWESKKIYLPKIGHIKTAVDRVGDGKIKSATISKTSSGKFFVSLLIDTGKEEPSLVPIIKETTIGVDLGLKDFAILSTGEKISSPKPLRKYLTRLQHLQRKSSRKIKGSNNRRKANKRVAVIHEMITNIRNDFLHKLSTRIIRENQTVCLEDLNVSGMMKSHHLARAISDAGWNRFTKMIGYKARWNGKNVLTIGRFEPSSKMCNVCGYIKPDLKLSDRSWICPKCCTMHDRDVNASVNIRDIALLKNKINIGGGLPEFKPVEKRDDHLSVKQETRHL